MITFNFSKVLFHVEYDPVHRDIQLITFNGCLIIRKWLGQWHPEHGTLVCVLQCAWFVRRGWLSKQPNIYIYIGRCSAGNGWLTENTVACGADVSWPCFLCLILSGKIIKCSEFLMAFLNNQNLNVWYAFKVVCTLRFELHSFLSLSYCFESQWNTQRCSVSNQ